VVEAVSDAEVLAGERGAWSATPWDYSSLRSIRFSEEGTGVLTYGYGQTIYAVINGRWELPSPGTLRFTYLESPPYQRFEGFTPSDGNRGKELGYKLTKGDVTGVESVVAQPYKFLWTLELSEQPWPACLQFPYDIPLVFYGYRQDLQRS